MSYHTKEDVEQLQEEHSLIIESIEGGFDGVTWTFIDAALLPAEEPWVDLEFHKETADFVVRARATCEYGVAVQDLHMSEGMLQDPMAIEVIPKEIVSEFERMREEKAQQSSDE